MRYAARILALLILASFVCFSAFGQVIDPNVGFCPTATASQMTCTTGVGLGGHTISVPTTGFSLLPNGNSGHVSNLPWFLILAIPEGTDGSVTSFPTITNTDGLFMVSAGAERADGADFTQTTSGDIYAFAGSLTGGLQGDNSMNAANLFCDGSGIPCTNSNEIAAFGKLPNDFEVVVYTMTATATNTQGLVEGTIYNFTSSGLSAGSYLAAVAEGPFGCDPTATSGPNKCNIQYSTPFTTTGLVNGHVPDSGVTLMMLGGALVGLETLRRRLRG